MAETLTARFKILRDPYLIIAVIYFFLNCLFLPEGLQYTTFLTPVFLWWLGKDKNIQPFILFAGITAVYAAIHFYIGVQPVYYFRSWFLAFCSFTFAVAISKYLKTVDAPEKLFEKIALINTGLIPVALLSLLVFPINEYFWYYKSISPGISIFPRLSMLTYEASYYVLLLMPVFLYLLLKVLLLKPSRPLIPLLMVAVPMALALSFGGILIMSITLIIVFILQFKNIIDSRAKLRWFIAGLAILFLASIAVIFVFPDNVIAHRISNAFNYRDTSLRGRTNEALEIAWEIACAKSAIFGVGFGQIKVVGHEIYFHFYKFTHPVVRIPNTVAENLAMFGILGILIRFSLEIWFFFSTKVYSNIYRLVIFIFVFIYQLQGSFMFNIAELTLWVIAFTPSFYQFDRNRLKQNSKV